MDCEVPEFSFAALGLLYEEFHVYKFGILRDRKEHEDSCGMFLMLNNNVI